MANVRLAVPNEGWFHRDLCASLLHMAANDCGHQVMVDFQVNKPVDNTRNRIIKDFLSDDQDFLLFIDSDNPPILGLNPLELVDENLDIVGCPTPIWRGKEEELARGKWPMIFNAFDYDPATDSWAARGKRGSGDITEVDAMGTGCILIARRVLEHPDMRPAFVREWDEDGCVKRGSDLLFCKRAKDAGFRVWCSWKHICEHYKEHGLLKIHQAMQMRDIKHAGKPNINTPEYWDEEWKKRPGHDYPFYAEIASKLEGKSVLDVGCGAGKFLECLNGTSEGAEIAPSAVEKCESKGLRVHLIDDQPGSIRRLSKNLGKKWDVITATEVLEHLDDDEGRLREWLEVADTVIYSVPFNCLPPSIEKEHRRVYTLDHVHRVTPDVREIQQTEDYLIVTCGKEL